MSSRVIHLKSEFTVQSVERIRRFDTFNGNVEKWRRILLIRGGYGIFDTRNKWCKCNEIEKEVATLVCKWKLVLYFLLEEQMKHRRGINVIRH